MHLPWLVIQALAEILLPSALALELIGYAGLKTSQHNNIIDIAAQSHINGHAWSQDTHFGMTDIVRRLQEDNEIKVVIFKSDVPRFFCNHFDPAFTDNYAILLINITNLSQVTIGAVKGRLRKAGHELLLALDMRFTIKKDVLIGETETGFSNFPVAGTCQHLPRLIGRGLAIEYILSSRDITAKETERISWIDKAFDSRRECAHIPINSPHVSTFPRSGLVATKKAINLRGISSRDDFLHDINLFKALVNPDFSKIVGRLRL
ncbi:ClpP/crotonase-like domain-containing protein [Cadophora sp. MPI-SDFR-AT-0126]|nr:ClpP/crotonase-like domain-containing protein [Leotiomycetes sp. MPI-SDFR-AT-0126]